MLIDLRIENFRSIKSEEVFSMQSIGKVQEYPDNTINKAGENLLRAALIYGRNSSGKSNLLKAFKAIQYLVDHSRNFEVGRSISCYEPFRYDLSTKSAPTSFAIQFIAKDGIKYAYEISFTAHEITKENLYFYPNKVKASLYERSPEGIKYGGKLKGPKKEIEQLLYKNQLYLSKVGTSKQEQLRPAYEFLSDYLYVQVSHDSDYDKELLRIIKKIIREEPESLIIKNLIHLLRQIDTGIDTLSYQEQDIRKFVFAEGFPEDLKQRIIEDRQTELQVKRPIFQAGQVLQMIESPLSEESTGTQKFLTVALVILEALSDGSLIVIDELDKSLHSQLTSLLIKLFLSTENNPYGAQLIFATHDSNLMDSKTFRRDQIWIAEKDAAGSTELYSLGDLKGVRKGIDYEKYYLEGAFGGLPMLNSYNIQLQFPSPKNKEQNA